MDKIVTKLIENSTGYSINTKGESPTSGYMVSLSGYERVLKTETGGNLTTNVSDYIKTHFDLVKHSKSLYFGIWFDNGFYYLDISENVKAYPVAMKLGKERNQLAIFDVTQGKTIEL